MTPKFMTSQVCARSPDTPRGTCSCQSEPFVSIELSRTVSRFILQEIDHNVVEVGLEDTSSVYVVCCKPVGPRMSSSALLKATTSRSRIVSRTKKGEIKWRQNREKQSHRLKLSV